MFKFKVYFPVFFKHLPRINISKIKSFLSEVPIIYRNQSIDVQSK